MGMSCCMSLSPSMRLSAKLSAKQMATVRLLLKMRLKHPEFDSVKGFEGILKGHKILEEKNEAGILVGGLSEDIWSRKRTKDELKQHKDVDIMVLGDSTFSDFEGGIDWWLPRKEAVNAKGDLSVVENIKVKWWQNAMGVKLLFGLKRCGEILKPGLYIHQPQWIVEMREAESLARISSSISIDDDVLEAFRKKIERRMGTMLPKYISNVFRNYISPPVEVSVIESEILMAIKSV